MVMDDRVSRGRGGSWKRGGRGGHDSEHRGRGRGGPHRGRGHRDFHRGRGRAGGGRAAEAQHRDQDEVDVAEVDDNRKESFSRRKLESNWDRYEASEKQEPDEDTPTQRGTDFNVLLESAGDSFTQFRFLEEKDWEMDSFAANQMSAVFVDLPALAQSLQQLPLHQRLHLEEELVQALTPVELPTMNLPLKPKQEKAKSPTFSPASAASKGLRVSASSNPLSGSDSQVPSNTEEEDDEGEEELDQLLGLQKPGLEVQGNQSAAVAEEESAAPEKACEKMKDVAPEVTEVEMKKEEEEEEEEVKALAPAKQELTEDDLEDWLDSMIS